MDIAGAISGSGPAFVSRLIEAMASAGVQSGIPRQTALEMAAQTFAGAAQMALQGTEPMALIHKIATPGGTTQAGLDLMAQQDLPGQFHISRL